MVIKWIRCIVLPANFITILEIISLRFSLVQISISPGLNLNHFFLYLESLAFYVNCVSLTIVQNISILYFIYLIILIIIN